MPSTIKLSEVIKIDNTKEYKLHAARHNGIVEPLDCYIGNKEEWLDWNRWRGDKNEFNRQYIFSLMDFYPEYRQWLFGGIFEVIGRKDVKRDHGYEIREVKEFSHFIGKLKVYLDVKRGRSFLLEKFWDGLTVTEILRETYTGAIFPGYENINYKFKELAVIFSNERADWKSPLENIKGVYVITDTSNGKKYVGSAYGEHGIWSRWSCYMGTGHGWNDELVKLINKKGHKYAQENFQLCLLEYYPMKKDDSFVIRRESFWKEALLSREHGYNKN